MGITLERSSAHVEAAGFRLRLRFGKQANRSVPGAALHGPDPSSRGVARRQLDTPGDPA
jgi:hypothetical protein